MIRPDLRKAAATKAESTTVESVIRPKQLVRALNTKNSFIHSFLFDLFHTVMILHV